MATAKCDQCGMESEIELAFIRERRWFGLLNRRYCPTCYQNRQKRMLKLYLLLIILVGLAAIALNFYDPGNWISLNLGYFFLLWLIGIPLLLLHEISHAITGTILRMRVFTIVIGTGKLLYSGRWLGINWEFRVIPASGVTIMGCPSSSFYRLRLFLTILAGPGIHLSLLLLLSGLYIRFYLLSRQGDALPPAVSTLITLLILANASLALVSLFPMRRHTLNGMVGSDGWGLLHAPFLSEKEQTEHLAAYYIQESLDHYNRQDYQAAKQWIQKGMDTYPDNAHVLNALGYIQFKSGEYEQARKTFVTLFQSHSGLSPELKLMVMNNIAISNLLIGDPQLLPEADAFSAEAYKNAPWMPAIAGTRGAVLAEKGQYDEGIALLMKAMAEQADIQAKAIDACLIAIAKIRCGEAQESQRYLNTARLLHPGCILIPRVEQELIDRSPDRESTSPEVVPQA